MPTLLSRKAACSLSLALRHQHTECRRRHVRLNTWAGCVQYRPYAAVRNVVCIEDPFDAMDNPGRSLALSTVDFVADQFLDAVQVVRTLRDKQGKRLTSGWFMISTRARAHGTQKLQVGF